jgi:hypothetical protein
VTKALDERLRDRVFVLDDEQVHALIVGCRGNTRGLRGAILGKSLPSPGSGLAGRDLPSRSTFEPEVAR